MAYEVNGPSCQARLDIKDDVGASWLLCPRCLNCVPQPAHAIEAIVAGPASAPTTPPAPTSGVPLIESETNQASWLGYFLVLAVTVLVIIGTTLLLAHSHIFRGGGDSAGFLVLTLLIFMVALAGLIVYPLGRSQFRSARMASARLGESPGRSAVRYFGVTLLMLVLFPVALFIIFFTVCTAVLITAS
jgi:hypothetical protein